MKPASVIPGFLALVVLLGACEPHPTVEQLARDMVVQTSYDNTANFSSHSTYILRLDTLGMVYNANPNDTLITGSYAQLISRQVRTNMDMSGYVRVGPTQNPDLGVSIVVVRDFSVFQTISYPSYYGGYPGYYGYGGYGYGGYPYISTYASNEATMVIEIADLQNLNGQNAPKVIWTCYIGDLLTSLDMNLKAKEAIDQAFVQSPYLRK